MPDMPYEWGQSPIPMDPSQQPAAGSMGPVAPAGMSDAPGAPLGPVAPPQASLQAPGSEFLSQFGQGMQSALPGGGAMDPNKMGKGLMQGVGKGLGDMSKQMQQKPPTTAPSSGGVGGGGNSMGALSALLQQIPQGGGGMPGGGALGGPSSAKRLWG